MQIADSEKHHRPKDVTLIRVRPETRERIIQDLDRLNQKTFGRKVTPDDVIALAVTLLKPEHDEQIQEATLTHFDRFERDYQTYISTHGTISKDDYLGKIRSGEIGK